MESEPGKGSTFHFTANFGVAAKQEIAIQPVELKGMRVLVVDDSPVSLQLLEQTLNAWQMRVTCRTDGVSAVAEFERARQSGEPYRLVVLDRVMPTMDGFETAAKIRKLATPDETRLMMLTAFGQRGDGARCRALHIEGYLRKPVRRMALHRGILDVLGMPVAPPPALPSSLVTRHTIQDAGRRILLAEDNVVNQRLAVKLLERQGHSVVIADNGREAVDALEREKFDLVLMDIQMPLMNGLEATTIVRQKEKATGQHIRIIALTAEAMSGDREKCLAAGMDGYLSKPIRLEELLAVL